MVQPEHEAGSDSEGTFDIDRRRTLKLIGGGAASVALFTGVASAHKAKFYGCSQVCTGSDGNLAVVATGDGYECRNMLQTSDRQNQEWKHTSFCYEVEGDEAIVGMLETEENDCFLCVNPNNCASNYYDDEQDIVDDLNASSTCGGCAGKTSVNGSCDVTGTGGGGGSQNSRRRRE